MAYFQPETRKTIEQRMVNLVVARTKLNDLTKTSQFFRVLRAVARSEEKVQQSMLDLLKDRDINLATGDELDEEAKKWNPIAISRLGATRATGSVVFSRSGTSGDVTISTGTQIKATGADGQDLVYATTAEGTISNGNSSSSPVAAQASSVGADYNVSAGTVTGFVTKPSGVDTVTNSTAMSGGASKESDDSFRNRLKLFRQSLSKSTVKALESACLGVTDGTRTVTTAEVVEDISEPAVVRLYIDDGTGLVKATSQRTDYAVLTAVGGEVDIYLPDKPIDGTATFTLKINAGTVSADDYYINYPHGHIKLKASAYPDGLTASDAVTASYTYYTGLVAEVQKVIDGDPADRSNYPGWRAAGVLVYVLTPEIVYVEAIANITVLSGFDQDLTLSLVEAAILEYINTLGIGDDVIWSEIVRRAKNVRGVYDIELTTPSNNYIVANGYMARSSTALIDLT